MIIKVLVKPSSSQNKVEQTKDGFYRVYTTKPARGNKANFAVIELVAEYFNTKKNKVFIVGGAKSRLKTVEILSKGK